MKGGGSFHRLPLNTHLALGVLRGPGKLRGTCGPSPSPPPPRGSPCRLRVPWKGQDEGGGAGDLVRGRSWGPLGLSTPLGPCYRQRSGGSRPGLLGSHGQRRGAAYPRLGPQAQALRSSAPGLPGSSVQDKERPCLPVPLHPTCVSSLPTRSPHAISKQQLGGRRKGKRRREVSLSGPQLVFLSLAVRRAVLLGSFLPPGTVALCTMRWPLGFFCFSYF